MTWKRDACFFCSMRRSDECSQTARQSRHPIRKTGTFWYWGSEPGGVKVLLPDSWVFRDCTPGTKGWSSFVLFLFDLWVA